MERPTRIDDVEADLIVVRIAKDIKHISRQDELLNRTNGEAVKGLTQKARIAYGTNKML